MPYETNITSLFSNGKHNKLPIGQMINYTYHSKAEPILGIITEHTETGYVICWNSGNGKRTEISTYEMEHGFLQGNYKIILDSTEQ